MHLYFKYFIWLLLLPTPAIADSPFNGQVFNYYGKLPETYRSQSSVSLEISFYESLNGNDIVSRSPRIFKDLTLHEAEFSVTIEMDQVEYDAVFPGKKPAFIQIKDIGRQTVFRRLPFIPSIQNLSATVVKAPDFPAAVTSPAPDFTDFMLMARAACIATNTAGAKFIVKTANTGTPCLNVCVHAESRSVCVRGWTMFSGGKYFEFGDECTKEATGFQAPVESRVCCCVTTARPMPAQLEPAHH